MLTKRQAKRILPDRLKNFRKLQQKLALIRRQDPHHPHLPENVEAGRRLLLEYQAAMKQQMIDEVEKEAEKEAV